MAFAWKKIPRNRKPIIKDWLCFKKKKKNYGISYQGKPRKSHSVIQSKFKVLRMGLGGVGEGGGRCGMVVLLMTEALLWVQRLENQECYWCSRAGEKWMFQRQQMHTFPTFLFCSNTQWLDDAHPYQLKWSLLSLQIQILVSSRNTLTDTSRNNISPAIWTSFSPIRLTIKLNHHNPCEVCYCYGIG